MVNKLAILTVIYQNYDVLTDLFSSLNKQTDSNFHIFIVDLSNRKKRIGHSRFNLTIINGQNLGYAHGVNIALVEAIKQGFTAFVVINSDVILDDKFVDNSMRAINNHPHSIIGGKIYYAKGFEYHTKRYERNELGKILWYAGGNVDWKNVFINHNGVDKVDDDRYETENKTEFVPGTLMIFDKSVVDTVGFWNEKYFLYFEDADFCERAKRKTINLYYDPHIIMWHKNAQSTGGSGSPLHQKYQQINRIRFGLKYAPLNTKLYLMKNYILNKK